MKINIANPPLSLQKTFDIEDEKQLMPFFEKRMGAEVPADTLGDEFKGYVLRITGGNDKQGFPMKQGVLKNGRVRLLFKKGMSCFKEPRGYKRVGLRKRKSVRGCIVGQDLAILSCVLVKKGDGEIAGLTDGDRPKRLGPKRASKIKKMFNLDAEDDPRKFVVRRQVKEGSKKSKAPKIQRLVTSRRIQRKRRVKKSMVKKVLENRRLKKEYATRMHDYRIAQKEKRAGEHAKKNKKKKSTEKAA